MRNRVLFLAVTLFCVGMSGCGKRIWAQTTEVQPSGGGVRNSNAGELGVLPSGSPKAKPSTDADETAAKFKAIQQKLRPAIRPGEVWKDTSGKVIQAHGGGVTRSGIYWYWFGEDRSQDLPAASRAVHVYRSKNLITWEDRGRALQITEPEEYKQKFGTDWQLERPKVYIARAGGSSSYRFVMYVHLDAAYKAAEVGVAGSNNIEGPYKLLKHFRPLGQESRDIGQFVDDDGTNYLIFESRPTGGFFLAKLSADALEVAEKTAFVSAPLEGGAIVHVGDLYYCVGSHMTGWKPNPNVYATANSLAGPWSQFQDIAPPESNTYNGQSAMLLKVDGPEDRDVVIFIGDIWKPKALWDSRYLWMPMKVDDGKMELPSPAPWRIDRKTASVEAAK